MNFSYDTEQKKVQFKVISGEVYVEITHYHYIYFEFHKTFHYSFASNNKRNYFGLQAAI